MPRYSSALCFLALAVLLAGCGTPPPPSKPIPQAGVNALRMDPLRIGDRIRIELTGIPETVQPSEQDVKDDGSISLPWIGRVPAAGRSPAQLEEDIRAKYVPDWFKSIGVTVTPSERYFYVGGQVNNTSGGRIRYTGPITVTGAIQAAGDFTPFANRRNVQVTRVDGTIEHINCIKALKNPRLDLPIFPGDRIFVNRRF